MQQQRTERQTLSDSLIDNYINTPFLL